MESQKDKEQVSPDGKGLLREIAIICAILAVSFGIRVYYLFSIPHPDLIYDAFNYDVTAKQLLDTEVFGYASSSPNAFTTPGYPLFLAIVYKIYGYSHGSPLTQVRIIQALLSSLTTVLLYLLAKRLINARTAIVTALLSSFYLVSIWVPTLILTETLYTFLFILYLYLQILSISCKSVYLSFLTGIVFGGAVLVRPAIAPLIVLPYIYYYFETKDKGIIKGFFVNLSGFAFIMLPWWIRNLVTLKKFILFATQEDPLLRGTYPYGIGEEDIPYSNQMQEACKRLIEGFTGQTLYYLKWYTLGKFNYLYFKIFYYVDEKITILRPLLRLHYFYVWLGWTGVLMFVVKKEIRLIALYIISITFIQLVFVATSRYAYPVMQLLILLTAYIIDILFFGGKAVKTADAG